MADRILVWHIDKITGDGTYQGPVYFLEQGYAPVALRLYARNAPNGEDLIVDIKDDGVSIFDPQVGTEVKTVYTEGSIEYNTLATASFQVGETVTGGTSGATGTVLSDNGIGSMTVRHTSSGTNFSVDETITGGTSSATANVTSWIAPTRLQTITSVTGTRGAILAKSDNLNEMAEDFNGSPELEEGSLISCDIVQAGGAGEITVQLELQSLSESDEESES